MAEGISLAGNVPDTVCGDYIKGRQRQQVSRKPMGRGESVIDFVHSDLEGPLPATSNGIKYFITMNDDATAATWVEGLKYKSETYKKVTKWITLLENQTGHKLKRWRTDWGREFDNEKFKKYFDEKG